MVPRLASSALLALLLVGCAQRGLRYPGPLRGMGWTPGTYADSLQQGEEADEVEARIARRPKRGGARGGEAVALAAGELVGCRRLSVDGETYRWDCSGMVTAAHAGADKALGGNSASMYEDARAAGVLHRKKEPLLGDVAFFDNTYDRNKNGRRDDELTHVAVVEKVDADGTITLVHLGSKGVVRLSMNLRRPHDQTDEQGKLLNSYLRARSGRDNGPVLTGELWKAFGSLWKLDEELGLADSE